MTFRNKHISVLVTGVEGCGRDIIFDTLSSSSLVSNQQLDNTTTIGMNYCHIPANDNEALILFGIGEDERFSFLYDTLADTMDGVIILINGNSDNPLQDISNTFQHYTDLPTVVCLSSQEEVGGIKQESIEQYIVDKDMDALVLPIVIDDYESILKSITHLVSIIEP